METNCFVCGQPTDSCGRRTCEHVAEPQKTFNENNAIIRVLNESVLLLSNEREEAKRILQAWCDMEAPHPLSSESMEFIERNS